MTARLRSFRPSELNDDQLEVYNAIAGGPRAGGPFALTNDDGSLRGPFNAMVLSPAIGLALQSVGAAVRYRSTLTDRAREMAILVVAAHWARIRDGYRRIRERLDKAGEPQPKIEPAPPPEDGKA